MPHRGSSKIRAELWLKLCLPNIKRDKRSSIYLLKKSDLSTGKRGVKPGKAAKARKGSEIDE